ncbi:MAG TPA: four helix bundle protein [Candidatus Methylomirabilis sp.]
MERVRSYRDLRVYQTAMDSAMRVFELTKGFPPEEKFAMVDQVRRSSRSVCTNLAEAWRKRRYVPHFASKLSDAETEAEETRVWLEFAFRCGYLSRDIADQLDDQYDKILAQLVLMISNPKQWRIPPGHPSAPSPRRPLAPS